jgi:4-amino-4-deoxy-L-arabinose transferase-like glycosyltransferase
MSVSGAGAPTDLLPAPSAGSGESTDARRSKHQASHRREGLLEGWWRALSAGRVPPITYALILTLVVTVIDAIWAASDHTGPSWDQSHYLTTTWIFQQALDHHGPVGLIRAIYTTDPARAPLFQIAMLPFSYIYHDGPEMGLALNVLMWPLILLSVGAIAKEAFNEKARLIAIVALAPMPGLLPLAHSQLQDFMLASIGTFAIWLIVRTRNLNSTLACASLGVVLALGTLTKISFVVVVVVPLLVAVFYRLMTGLQTRGSRSLWPEFRRPLFNLVVIGALAIGPALLWYVPNWAATRAYLQTTFKQQPGTVAHPFALHNLHVFGLGILNSGLGLFFCLLALAVLLLSVPQLFKLRIQNWLTWFKPAYGAYLLSWFAIPIITVAASTNQVARYAVAAFPAAAVILAGLITGLPWASIRRAAVAILAVVAVDTMLYVGLVGFSIPGVPSTLSFSTPIGELFAQTASPPGLGDAPFPVSRNYTLNVIKYLESQSRGPSGKVKPRTIAILELQGYLNGNNLPYWADIRGDPFTFPTIFTAPSTTALADELKGYDFVLYIPQPPATQETANGVVGELNADTAARQMTPGIFALFKPHPVKIFAGAGQAQGDYVYVLERR